MRSRLPLALAALALAAAPAPADDADTLKKVLATPCITPRTTTGELQEFVDPRIPKLPEPTTAADWAKQVEQLQKDVLDKVVFRGEAVGWRTAKVRVEFADTVPGKGYAVRKLRYEIVPGFWVPALLYVPDKLAAAAPVMLAVNGHDQKGGKAAGYKQTRCINLAKRGMIVLNAEWLGMGQLYTRAYHHGAMNQLDLCGTSGLSLFYLSMSRGLDLLLAQPHADPKRVCVSGLSGGGWQTIFIGGLDTRVTLANPVAGYSSFLTRTRHYEKDLGDSEQTPTDLATVVDYAHLTAMRAPRPTLLTYNAKDNCCFEAGYALPPLVRAAEPFFKLNGAEKLLRTHINHDPGDHNFGQDNREALYRMVGDVFFPGDEAYSAKEIPCDDELKTPADLAVELPEDNLSTNGLALKLAADLPKRAAWPAAEADAAGWQEARRKELAALVKLPSYTATAGEPVWTQERGGTTARGRVVKAGPWSVPVVEVTRGAARRTAVLVGDGGRAAVAAQADALLKDGYRVVVADPMGIGECLETPRNWLWGLMLATIGERPLGVQAGQLAAVAKWAGGKGGVTLVAVGPRTGAGALVAAATDPRGIAALELHDTVASFKEVIETNKVVSTGPELYTFGLLEKFDAADVAALVAPRPVAVKQPSDRAKTEFARLAGWYKTLGADFDPVK